MEGEVTEIREKGRFQQVQGWQEGLARRISERRRPPPTSSTGRDRGNKNHHRWTIHGRVIQITQEVIPKAGKQCL